MAPATLLASAVLALATGAGFAAVGWLMLRRVQPAQGGGALVTFGLFWFSAAIVWTTQGLGSLLGWTGHLTIPLLSALDQVSTPFYCLAAAGLLYYVLYLLTGRARLLGPILAYYLVAFFLLRWRVESARRTGVVAEDWVVRFEYATPLQGPAYTLVVGLIAVPLLLAILAYGSLLFRVDDPAARYRIALVTAGLLAWVSTEALSYVSGFAATTAGELLRRLVALGSTLVILAAYLPPRIARERWGVTASE